MGRRTATDILAECVIELVHEYKQQIKTLNQRIDYLAAECKEQEKKRMRAVIQADGTTDILGEVADIIAGITDHTENGNIRICLSDIIPEDSIKLKRLFRLLDIPMTAEQIKDGDTIDED